MNQSTQNPFEEKEIRRTNGMSALLMTIILYLIDIAAFVLSIIMFSNENFSALSVTLMVLSTLYMSCIGWIPILGLKVIKPNEALVLTLFGRYYGTLKHEGFYFVNPFVSAVNPAAGTSAMSSGNTEPIKSSAVNSLSALSLQSQSLSMLNKKVSLKVTTLNNDRQKINDQLGNPISIGIVVVWKVINPTKAVFNVDNYKEYLSIQCDSALRNIVRLYPYDVYGDDKDNNEKTLRGSSQEIADKLKAEIQAKTEVAGIEIMEARITHLAYAPEIAAAMLQRQQASAVIDARQMIVEGAVGMVEMALARLSEKNVVQLDDERKAAMVSNLLVVLCGNRDAQPIVNSGSLY
ncbi:MAG: SPFH domain-containing protein [Treponema sp.]|jgi:regulator of protease activity HflC (stomatin/prohibitin superfamily)|nr:SPFH domain-containing protein [Treponema sp.]